MPAMSGCGFITRETLCGPSCTFNAAPTPCPVPVIRYMRYVAVVMRSGYKVYTVGGSGDEVCGHFLSIYKKAQQCITTQH